MNTWHRPLLCSFLVGLGLALTLLCTAADQENLDDKQPAQPRKETLVTLRAKPEIKALNGYSLLVLSNGKDNPIELLYHPQNPRWRAQLSPDKELTFTMWKSKLQPDLAIPGEEISWWHYDIETIKDGALVIYDASVCPLHQIQMERSPVEISYGLPMGEFLEAHKKFSGGPGFVLGGCVVGPEKFIMGYRCKECVTAYVKWEADFEAVATHATEKK